MSRRDRLSGEGGGREGGAWWRQLCKFNSRYTLLCMCFVFALRGIYVFHFAWEHDELPTKGGLFSKTAAGLPSKAPPISRLPTEGESTRLHLAAVQAQHAEKAVLVLDKASSKPAASPSPSLSSSTVSLKVTPAQAVHEDEAPESRTPSAARGGGKGISRGGSATVRGGNETAGGGRHPGHKGQRGKGGQEAESASDVERQNSPEAAPPTLALALPPAHHQVQGQEGVIADGMWDTFGAKVENHVHDHEVILTSAYYDDLPILLNWIVRIDAAKMMLMMNTKRSFVVLALDEKLYQALEWLGDVPCFLVGASSVPLARRVEVELLGKLHLLRKNMQVIWADVATVWSWDVGSTWLRAFANRLDLASPACKDGEICRSLMSMRSNPRTISLLEEAVRLAREGKGVWGVNGGIGGLAHMISAGGGGAAGVESVQWFEEITTALSGIGDKVLAVKRMSKRQFPVIGVHGEWEQLMNGGLVWIHGNDWLSERDSEQIRQAMLQDNVYFLVDDILSRNKSLVEPSDLYCKALDPVRILAHGRQSAGSTYMNHCQSRGIILTPVAAPKGRHRGGREPAEKIAMGGKTFRMDDIGSVYSYGKQEGESVQVIMQLSQGRAGSTVTANMMLRSHPYCGMYLDELLWGIYRTHIAKETPHGDLKKVLDIFFNSTQCVLPTRLWGDGKGGEPGTLATWFGKRDRFGMGPNARSKDYFKIDNQAKVCSNLRQSSPEKAVCVKELKFLGRVGELLQGAVDRGVRFSLLYLLRDPRGNALSQLYAFSSKWFAHLADPMRDLLKEHCKIGAMDVQAVIDHSGKNGIEAEQICFEEFKDTPKEALKRVYTEFPPFKRWQDESGQQEPIPADVSAFAEEHIANWKVNGSQAHIASQSQPILYGQVPIGFDHHYSTDVSRIVHVDGWKDVYVRDVRMQEVWEQDENCLLLRKISRCAQFWDDLREYKPLVTDVPIDQLPPGSAEKPKDMRGTDTED